MEDNNNKKIKRHKTICIRQPTVHSGRALLVLLLLLLLTTTRNCIASTTNKLVQSECINMHQFIIFRDMVIMYMKNYRNFCWWPCCCKRAAHKHALSILICICQMNISLHVLYRCYMYASAIQFNGLWMFFYSVFCTICFLSLFYHFKMIPYIIFSICIKWYFLSLSLCNDKKNVKYTVNKSISRHDLNRYKMEFNK